MSKGVITMKKHKALYLMLIVVLIISTLAILLTGCFKKNITENVTVDNANLVFSKIAENLLDSTVTVTCNVSGGGTSGGSGVVITSDGYVITNYHVVQNAINGKATVAFTDKENPNITTRYTAKILNEKNDGSQYSKMDLAVLKIDSNQTFIPAQIKSEAVKWGEYGIIVGNPKQLGSLCAHAMVSNPKRTMSHNIPSTYNQVKEVKLTTEFMMLDAPVNPGNSGGGFFDSNGKLAGIVTLRQYDNSEANENVTFGIAYAIPAESIVGYVKRYGITM